MSRGKKPRCRQEGKGVRRVKEGRSLLGGEKEGGKRSPEREWASAEKRVEEGPAILRRGKKKKT